MQPSERYTWTAIALHWLIAVAVIVQFKWGWWMQDIPKLPPGPRVDAYNLHKSVGLTILALMMMRLLWRWRHPAPALPPMPDWQRRLAHANHWVLYAALFVMPVAGYLGSVFSGYPVKYFGMTLPAWGPKDRVAQESLQHGPSRDEFRAVFRRRVACDGGAEACADRPRRIAVADGHRNGAGSAPRYSTDSSAVTKNTVPAMSAKRPSSGRTWAR